MPRFHVRDMLGSEHITAIGYIAAEWELLQAYLQVAIWSLLGTSRAKGLAITSDLSATNRRKLFSALCHEQFPANSYELQEAKQIDKLIDDLNTERNNWIHNIWQADETSQRLKSKKFSARSGKVKEPELQRTAEQLMACVSQIQSVADQIDDFQKKHVEPLPSDITQQR